MDLEQLESNEQTTLQPAIGVIVIGHIVRCIRTIGKSEMDALRNLAWLMMSQAIDMAQIPGAFLLRFSRSLEQGSQQRLFRMLSNRKINPRAYAILS